MIGIDALVAVPALVLALTIGLVTHEYAHALVLHLAGVEYAVEYFPDRADGVVATLSSCRWAQVRPRPTGREPAWVFRVAALMPLSLALPVLALGVGGHLSGTAATAATIGWLACAIPSPRDFSVAFYAHRVLEEVAAGEQRHVGPVE